MAATTDFEELGATILEELKAENERLREALARAVEREERWKGRSLESADLGIHLLEEMKAKRDRLDIELRRLIDACEIGYPPAAREFAYRARRFLGIQHDKGKALAATEGSATDAD